MYNLVLFKRTGGLTKAPNDNWLRPNEKPSRYHVLGYYDFMRVRRLKGLSSLFRGNDHAYEPPSYARHSMTLFEITPLLESESNIVDRIIEGAGDSFIIATSCVIRKGLSYSTDDPEKYSWPPSTGKEAMEMAKAAINNWIAENAKGVEYQILGNLGNFDITILVESDNLSELIRLPSRISAITHPLYNPSTKDTEHRTITTYSSSFISYNGDSIDKGRIKDTCTDFFSLNMHFATYLPRQDNRIIEELSEAVRTLKKDEQERPLRHTFSTIVGEYSIEAHIENLTAADIVELFNLEWFDVTREPYSRTFRSVYSLVSVENNNDDPDTTPKSAIEPYPDFWQARAKKMSEDLLLARAAINAPYDVAYTLDRCIQSAITLLHDDLKYYLGQQLVMMLTDALKDAKKSFDYCNNSDQPELKRSELVETWNTNLEKLIIKCSALLASVHPANCFLQDSNESQNEVNAILKVFLAYQQLVNDIATTINAEVSGTEKPGRVPKHTFVTIGAEGSFHTGWFEWPILTDNTQDDDDGFIMALDFPGVTSLAIRNTVEVFLHEVGHRLILNGWGNSGLKESLHLVLFRYCVQLLVLLDYSSRELQFILDADTVKSSRNAAILALNNAIADISPSSKLSEQPDNGEMEPMSIPVELTKGIMSVDTFKDRWMDLLSNIGRFKGEMQENREALAMNSSFIEILCDAAMEARADALMICLCGFDLRSYLAFMHRYFTRNMLCGSIDDARLSYRLAALLCMFYRSDLELGDKDINKDTKPIKVWWQEKSASLSPSEASLITRNYHGIISNAALMDPFAKYLCRLRDTFERRLSKAADKNKGTGGDTGAGLINLMRSLAAECDEGKLLDEELWLYVNAWYRGRRGTHSMWHDNEKWGNTQV